MKILFILQYDSFIRTLIPVIEELNNSVDTEIILYKKWKERNWINESIIKLLNNKEYSILGLSSILKKIKQNYNLIVIGSVGGRFISKISKYIINNNLTTKLATGYVGALLNNYPKGFLKGLNRRAETDYIWSPGLLFTKKIIASKIIDRNKTYIDTTGLPQLDKLYKETKMQNIKKRTQILFLEQPTFPKTKKERINLLFELNLLAKEFSDCKLIIKPRFPEKIGHAHRLKYPLTELINKIDNKESNLIFSNKELSELFPQTKFSLTISSTAGIESLLLGIPTYFINNYCKGINKYGSDDFNSFNTVTSINKIPDILSNKINYKLAKSFLCFDGNNTKRLTKGLLSIIKH